MLLTKAPLTRWIALLGALGAVLLCPSPPARARAGEAAEEARVVETPLGALRGVAKDGVAVFRGIAYAKAPVGDLRWRAPQETAPWQGVRDATHFGAICPQPASAFYPQSAMNEDCLFLNVWTPAHARGAPVMVWIHGGSLVSGAGSDALYDGANFARHGVIVVSINYRLGALGWLAHPGLSAESGANTSGNYGLLDQIAALRWVRRNINAFGGDPDRVTIAGESAGALSVICLLASDAARGLYQRAIAQSGYMITMPQMRDTTFVDWPDAEAAGLKLAQVLGASDVSSLRAAPAQRIVEASGRGYFPLPTIDGRILRRQLADTFDRGEQARVPILVGFNAGEIRSLRFLLPPAPVDAAAYTREIRARYGALADAFLEHYPASNIDESMLAATRDAMYGWTAEHIAIAQTAIAEPAFLYYFDHGYPAMDDRGFHAFHASEIPYVFGTTALTQPPWPPIPNTEQEMQMSAAMLGYWANFVSDGDPKTEGQAEWGPYDASRTYMAFARAPHLAQAPPDAYSLHNAVECRRRAQRRFSWNWNVGVIAPPLPAAATPCN
jgi:para-nitrobenzyl esterase